MGIVLTLCLEKRYYTIFKYLWSEDFVQLWSPESFLSLNTLVTNSY